MSYTMTQREVKIELTGLVRTWQFDDGPIRYDWVTDNDESDETFDTEEDAEYDLLHHY